MKRYKIISWTREFFDLVIGNSKIFILSIVLLNISYFFYIRSMNLFYTPIKDYLSIADFYILGMDIAINGFLITPIIISLSYTLNVRDFYCNLLVKNTSKKQMFLKQVVKSGYLSISFAILSAISIAMFSSDLSKKFINWDVIRSLFYLNTKLTIHNVSILKVILLFIVISFIRYLFICLVSIILYWGTGNRILAYIIFISVGVAELCFNKVKIFYKWTNINHLKWINQTEQLDSSAYLLELSLMILVCAFWVVNKKEFLGSYDK